MLSLVLASAITWPVIIKDLVSSENEFANYTLTVCLPPEPCEVFSAPQGWQEERTIAQQKDLTSKLGRMVVHKIVPIVLGNTNKSGIIYFQNHASKTANEFRFVIEPKDKINYI